jgi:RNA polymerase sigma-70 factor (ECF subfamily)
MSPRTVAISFARLLPSESAPTRVDRGTERADAAMDRYARGDDSAFADVYDAVAPRVHAYLLQQTRDRARADDLLQMTLLQMHRSRGSYIAGLPVRPWAISIARRLYIDEFRRRKRDALAGARSIEEGDRVASSQPDDDVVSRETASLIQAELARIPETQRVAFELLRVHGLSQDEAAQLLGTTVSAVKLRAFRAYKALRAALSCAVDDANIEIRGHET